MRQLWDKRFCCGCCLQLPRRRGDCESPLMPTARPRYCVASRFSSAGIRASAAAAAGGEDTGLRIAADPQFFAFKGEVTDIVRELFLSGDYAEAARRLKARSEGRGLQGQESEGASHGRCLDLGFLSECVVLKLTSRVARWRFQIALAMGQEEGKAQPVVDFAPYFVKRLVVGDSPSSVGRHSSRISPDVIGVPKGSPARGGFASQRAPVLESAPRARYSPRSLLLSRRCWRSTTTRGRRRSPLGSCHSCIQTP